MLGLLCLVLAASALPTPQRRQPLKIPLEMHSQMNDTCLERLARRDMILELPTDVHQVLLTFSMNLAEQEITAVVDTGSFSTWLMDSTAPGAKELCDNNSCLVANDQVEVTEDNYKIRYMGGFGSNGHWAHAPLKVAGQNSVDFKFGLAESSFGSSAGYAWAGFGYSRIFQSAKSQILDALKDSDVIQSRIIGLEYEPLTSWSNKVMGRGTLFLGGYDGDKELTYLSFDNTISSCVKFQNVENSQGQTLQLGYNQEVLFDSGSTNLLMKKEYKDILYGHINMSEEHPGFFKCSDYSNETIKFNLGEKTLTVPLLSTTWNNYQEDHDLCQLMVTEMSDTESYELVLGQYMLKNLVTVIDVESSRVGLAPNSEGVTLQ